jgi:hypothetical protein
MSQFEQWKNKFCQKMRQIQYETFQMIRQSYCKKAFGSSAVFKWHKRFAQGRDSLKDDEHAGQPRMMRTEFKIQLQRRCLPTAPKRYMKLQQQQQKGLAMVLATKFCLMT